MWRCKIRQVCYFMHKFITNKMKKSYHSVFFSYFFFSWRGDLFLVWYVNLNACWKNADFLSMQWGFKLDQQRVNKIYWCATLYCIWQNAYKHLVIKSLCHVVNVSRVGEYWVHNSFPPETHQMCVYISKLQPTRCNVSWFIYFYRCSTCFRQFLRPSSGVQNCTIQPSRIVNQYCC